VITGAVEYVDDFHSVGNRAVIDHVFAGRDAAEGVPSALEKLASLGKRGKQLEEAI
jgi:hypothetical protein